MGRFKRAYAYTILGGRDRAHFLRTSKPFVEPVIPLGTSLQPNSGYFSPEIRYNRKLGTSFI